jgi:hypothetical protein
MWIQLTFVFFFLLLLLLPLLRCAVHSVFCNFWILYAGIVESLTEQLSLFFRCRRFDLFSGGHSEVPPGHSVSPFFSI